MNSRAMTRRRLLATLPLAAASKIPTYATTPDNGESVLQAGELATVAGLRFSTSPTVRLGFIGVGRRGMALLDNFLAVDGVRVAAICDLSAAQTRAARAMAEKAGSSSPQLYSGGASDFENLCRRDDIDLVVVATPWSWHARMALCAMKQGRHVAVEVPMATSVEDCWKLVHMSEQCQRHCIMLENCCYGYNELRRLSARSSRQTRIGNRTALAARRVCPAQRQPISDAWTWPDCVLHGYQPRRPVRLPCITLLARQFVLFNPSVSASLPLWRSEYQHHQNVEWSADYFGAQRIVP